MPSTRLSAELRHAAPVFAALGDDMRLRLVARLCAGEPLSITRLSQGVKITRQAVTKHLHVLEDAGLIEGARNGREQVWELRSHGLDEARRYLSVITKQWDGALGRLKALVEEEGS